MIQNTV